MISKKWLAIVSLALSTFAHAFAPQSGSWVINSEVNGQPGRGFALDVQNETLVITMYAYERNGLPTFYVGSGAYANDQASVDLIRFTGGRFLGSGEMNASSAGSVGKVSLRFTSGTKGFITLPGEGEKEVTRFNFGYPAVPNTLLGLWTFTSLGASSQGLSADAVSLVSIDSKTANGNGLVISADGLFGCEHQISGVNAGTVFCIKVNAQGAVLRSYSFFLSVNEGEGISAVSNSAPSQALIVRRLTSPNTVGTGIFFKSTSAHPALAGHIEALSQMRAVQP